MPPARTRCPRQNRLLRHVHQQPAVWAFRGFGVTQSAFAVEQNMDILARELGIDPIELRRKNALRAGSTTATGQTLRESVGLVACLDWVESRVKELRLSDSRGGSTQGGEPPTSPNSKIAWVSRLPTRILAWAGSRRRRRDRNRGLPDGTAEARASSADMGQGLVTVVAQCVAEELGLPFDRVRVLLSDTDLSPDGGPTTASRQTYITGNASRFAAREMRERLARVAAEHWDVSPEAVHFEEGQVWPKGGVEVTVPRSPTWWNGSSKRVTSPASPFAIVRLPPRRWARGATCILPLVLAPRLLR